MSDDSLTFSGWLKDWMETQGISLWGVADIRQFKTVKDKKENRFPYAISWAIPMNPLIMAGIQNGPNKAYADEYARVNALINETADKLADEIRGREKYAQPLPASERTDKISIKGAFPHKTAATRSGLGWIGKHCQLITREFGPWIRLGTVFTDMNLPIGIPVEREFCGRCMRCVDACPAKALKGSPWKPGLPREDILDVKACDRWKKEHYFQFHSGHNCGICSAVCPYGLKVLKKKQRVS